MYNIGMRVITWNIAGGKKIKSLEQWDYDENIDLNYFVDRINRYNPDIVALQETLLRSNYNQTEILARAFDFKYFTLIEMSPDHIEKDTKICISLLSKRKLENIKQIMLPYPKFKCVFKNGTEAKRYDKYILSCMVDGINFATLQMQPIHLWGYNYYNGDGREYAREIDTTISNLNEPLVLLGDLQHNDPEKYLPNFYSQGKREALPLGTVTRPRKEGNSTMSDHIVISSNIRVIETHVEPTFTDHYLCYADLSNK